MNEGVSLPNSSFVAMVLLELFVLLLSLNDCNCKSVNYLQNVKMNERSENAIVPQISPTSSPQPFLPLLAPSPLTPFTNTTVPKLSGKCTLNFTAAESLMSMTAIDCFSVFAPLLATVMCCPQLEATLTILIAQSSKDTNMLALNANVSKYCLSDVGQILVSQGATNDLKNICSIQPSNLTAGYCPVKDVNEFESRVDSSMLLAACDKIDPVRECCDQICQNAISDAATSISLAASEVLSMDGSNGFPNHATRIADCRNVVLRWLASKLAPSRARELIRGLTNCNVNKVCPLVLPDTRHVVRQCGNKIINKTVCCNAMESYISHLQKQSLITNLQALDCATNLGMKLQKSNITRDVYSLCHITLKDFSLQVAKQESGCLLPSLPSDATLDPTTGVTFICDLNDNIPAPWPSSSQLSVSSCNRTVKIPALPANASGQNGLDCRGSMWNVFYAASAVMAVLVQVFLPIRRRFLLC